MESLIGHYQKRDSFFNLFWSFIIFFNGKESKSLLSFLPLWLARLIIFFSHFKTYRNLISAKTTRWIFVSESILKYVYLFFLTRLQKGLIAHQKLISITWVLRYGKEMINLVNIGGGISAMFPFLSGCKSGIDELYIIKNEIFRK